jgi:kinesin family protein C1
MQGGCESNTSLTEKSGILPRAAFFIFEELSRLNILGQSISLSFSAIEIYNENIFDLLTSKKQALNIYLNTNEIKGLTWIQIKCKEDIIKFTKEASDSRRCDSTQFNSASSRSHAIFQIRLERDNTYNTINIIDLAGSERSSLSFGGKTKEEIELGKRIQNEANFINKSLTTLGRIISMIGDKNIKLAIPYRESKLTMILQVIFVLIRTL